MWRGADLALIEENTGKSVNRQGQNFRRLSKKARGSATAAVVSGGGDVEEVGKELEDELFEEGADGGDEEELVGGASTERVRSEYGASTERVWSEYGASMEHT